MTQVDASIINFGVNHFEPYLSSWQFERVNDELVKNPPYFLSPWDEFPVCWGGMVENGLWSETNTRRSFQPHLINRRGEPIPFVKMENKPSLLTVGTNCRFIRGIQKNRSCINAIHHLYI